MRKVLDWNVRLSHYFDRCFLPAEYSIDGNFDFHHRFATEWVAPNISVADIGGGKRPFVSLETKKALGICVTGIDISEYELAQAPVGAYDITLCGDITEIRGSGDLDVCVCQALLEHVKDVEAAFNSIASFLKPGGIALIFVPSRNAVFARLNLILPERLKRLMLFRIFPQTEFEQGFPSYYNRCTPAEFRSLAHSVGFEIEDEKHYYCSTYFSFFAPFHILWRLWILVFRRIAAEQAAETFSVALRHKGGR